MNLTPTTLTVFSTDLGVDVEMSGFTVDSIPGLAVTPSIEHGCEGKWQVTHIRSGWKMPGPARPTAADAAEELREIAPLTDWTQSQEALRATFSADAVFRSAIRSATREAVAS